MDYKNMWGKLKGLLLQLQAPGGEQLTKPGILIATLCLNYMYYLEEIEKEKEEK